MRGQNYLYAGSYKYCREGNKTNETGKLHNSVVDCWIKNSLVACKTERLDIALLHSNASSISSAISLTSSDVLVLVQVWSEPKNIDITMQAVRKDGAFAESALEILKYSDLEDGVNQFENIIRLIRNFRLHLTSTPYNNSPLPTQNKWGQTPLI